MATVAVLGSEEGITMENGVPPRTPPLDRMANYVARGMKGTPQLSPASHLENIQRRKQRTPNDAADRIPRASTREHSEQINVARDIIRMQQDEAEKDRSVVGDSLERICNALEGSLQYIQRLAEVVSATQTSQSTPPVASNSDKGGSSNSNISISEVQGELRAGSSSQTIQVGFSVCETVVDVGNPSLVSHTPTNGKRKRHPQIPHTLHQ